MGTHSCDAGMGSLRRTNCGGMGRSARRGLTEKPAAPLCLVVLETSDNSGPAHNTHLSLCSFQSPSVSGIDVNNLALTS